MIQTDTGNKTTLRNYEIALIQMDTQNDKGENMKKACRFIDEAAAHGSRLICFPEAALPSRYRGRKSPEI